MPEPRIRQRAIAWRFPTHDENDKRPTVLYSWHSWLSIYAKRWTYTAPWGCSRWALPRVMRSADEWCNDTLLIQLPFLGHVVLWKPFGPLRTTRCDQCVADGCGDDDD